MATDWRNERRDFWIYAVGRPLLFVFWSLVAWGTLYAGLFTYCGMTKGFVAAWAQARSGRDVLGGVLNIGLASWATLLWSVVFTVLWRARRQRRKRLNTPDTPI